MRINPLVLNIIVLKCLWKKMVAKMCRIWRINFTLDWKRYKSPKWKRQCEWGWGNAFFSLTAGKHFNNSLNGLIKHPKETPRRGRVYWRERSLYESFTLTSCWSTACIFNEGWLHFINRPLKIKIILILPHLGLLK